MQRQHSFPLLLMGLCLIVTSLGGGCGKSTAHISGKVLQQGKPVSQAVLDFTLLAEQPKVYRGVSLPDGAYVIDYGVDGGLAFGKYRITVTRTETLDGSPLPTGEEGAALLSSGKAQDRSYLLEKEITSSSTTFDLSLDGISPVEVPTQ